MKLLSITTVIFIFIFLMGCGGSQSDSSGSVVDIRPDQLSTVIDPVCKMNLENNVIADTTTHKGKLYGFCNTGCKEAFLEEPGKYLD